MRREFHLPEEDVRFLDREAPAWEALQETLRQGNQTVRMMWVLIHDYPLPDGYTANTATAAIHIPEQYPEAPLDMAYFHPHLARKDGKIIPQTQCVQSIDGKQFQRWSRHYTAQNPWKLGEYSLETHYYAIANWLEREFRH